MRSIRPTSTSQLRPPPSPPAVRTGRRRQRHSAAVSLLVVAASTLAVGSVGTAFDTSAGAATTVQLGTATPFAVLAGQAVTDVPTSSITGDVGLSPATGGDYAGLTKAEVTGTTYATDANGPGGSVNDPGLLTQAKNDLTTAYISAAGQLPTSSFTTGDNQLGGKTLTAGVYAFGHAASANITAASPLVLNGQGDANSVFVFQASSDLVTASGSVVQLENGAQACNVFWQVGSSATLATSSTFVGTIMALTSATLDSGATVQGRVLARNGAVTLDANTITTPPACAASSSTGTTGVGNGSTPTSVGAGGPSIGAAGAAGSGTAGGAVPGSGTSTGAGSTGSPGSTGGVVPLGYPKTGLGGTAHAHFNDLIVWGGLALVLAAGAFTVIFRRRHHVIGDQSTPPGA